jgi:hypothetical protein
VLVELDGLDQSSEFRAPDANGTADAERMKRFTRRWRRPAEFGAHPKSLTSRNAQLIESDLQENVERGVTIAASSTRRPKHSLTADLRFIACAAVSGSTDNSSPDGARCST